MKGVYNWKGINLSRLKNLLPELFPSKVDKMINIDQRPQEITQF